jgi:hypothetical protein
MPRPFFRRRTVADPPDTESTSGVHRPDTWRWWHGAMTASPDVRPLPDEASVVEVYGSKFLLEWLDWDVLASAAALYVRESSATPTAEDPDA